MLRSSQIMIKFAAICNVEFAKSHNHRMADPAEDKESWCHCNHG